MKPSLRRAAFGSRRRFRCALLAALPLVALAPASRADLITATWLAPTSGNWTDASMWSSSPSYPANGSPAGTTYAAAITVPGSYTVTLRGILSVDRLTLDAKGRRCIRTAWGWP